MGKMTFDILLRAAVLIIPQGVLKRREVKKHFWAEIAARIHQFIGGIWGRFCDTFVPGNTYKGSVLPVFQVRVRAKLAPTVFIRYSLVFRSSS